MNFYLLASSDALNMFSTLPSDYPKVDFYGSPINEGAAAGAVQSTTNGNYYLDLSINNTSMGTVVINPENVDFTFSSMITLTANPSLGYDFGYWVIDGNIVENENPLVLYMDKNVEIEAVFGRIVVVNNLNDATGSENIQGTIRHAIKNAQDWDIISFTGITPGSSVVELNNRLEITKNIIIKGNGVTFTQGASFDPGNIGNFNALNIRSQTIIISGIHFKNFTNIGSSGRVLDCFGLDRGNLILYSCIFSGNRGFSVIGLGSGKITMMGCTFYGNNVTRSIISTNNLATGTITGNIFYKNVNESITTTGISSGGFNVIDDSLTIGNIGFLLQNNDITSSNLPISTKTFRLLDNSEALNTILTLPKDYPKYDYYGNLINNITSSGAVQSMVNGTGYHLDLSVNNSTFGQVNVSTQSDDFIFSGTITLTANPSAGCEFGYWLVDGINVGSMSTFELVINKHTTVLAVFSRLINVIYLSDALGAIDVPGTLRHSIANAQDGDIIRIINATPGISTIELTNRITIDRNITIEGNGVILTRSSTSWLNSNTETSQLFYINSLRKVDFSRIHFKESRATYYSGVILNNGGEVNIQSCIFSQNTGTRGGVIWNWGSTAILSMKGCTFYLNTGSQGGVIYNDGTLTLTGNLFYGNTASTSSPIVFRNGGTVISGGYNVVDVAFGTTTAQCGWTAVTGDRTFSSLSISGIPFNSTTFIPVSGLSSVMPSSTIANFPILDFNGNIRTWPGAPGAVR